MKAYAVMLLGAFAWPLLAGVSGKALSIVELQPGRVTESVYLLDSAGRQGQIDLINLNPLINSSFLLILHSPGSAQSQAFHLENTLPDTQQLTLKNVQAGQLRLLAYGKSATCVLWPGTDLEQARESKQPFAPLCDGRLFIRNTVRGRSTALETTTQYLRDYVWQGEKIVGAVRRGFYEDAFMERGKSGLAAPGSAPAIAGQGPPAAVVLPAQAMRPLVAEGLGVDVGTGGALLQGQWYGAVGLDGVYLSLVRPGALAPPTDLAANHELPLDAVESEALSYVVAFDLAKLDLGFALGTEHPRLNWSARVPLSRQDVRLPGPDGLNSAVPLVRNGIVAPWLQPRVVATFTGGFKREHGAFRYGPLATSNHGSHYGFIEQGVVYSRLVPGLSTIYVLRDGQVGMKTWRVEDNRLLPELRHARQNGVALLEHGPAGESPVLGSLLNAWGAGNWSGSVEEKLRTLRAGACMVEGTARRFLLYGYFSTATPRAMARVFQAYGCSYAMHLDMNALEHTYLALLLRVDENYRTEHLVSGMAALDTEAGATQAPRFMGAPSNRDFFYVMTRKQGQ